MVIGRHDIAGKWVMENKLLVRDSKTTFLGIKKRRDGKVILFRYMWFYDSYINQYVFQYWTFHPGCPTSVGEITEKQLSSVQQLDGYIRGQLGIKSFSSGLK